MKKAEPDFVVRTLANLADKATAPARALVEVLSGGRISEKTSSDLVNDVASEFRDSMIEHASEED